MKTDIIIIGAGPAGLTAAIYARRAGKSVKIIERSTFGGQMTYSPKIENYPAFEAISGIELADKMVTQALSLGAEIELEEVVSVVKNGEGDFTVTTTDGEHSAASVIIAAGAEHRRLGFGGEDDLIGNEFVSVVYSTALTMVRIASRIFALTASAFSLESWQV